MYRIPLLDSDRVVLLTPRWGDLGPAAQVGLLLVICLVPALLVAWLYRYEMRLVKRGTALSLLALRLVALLLILFLVCLQPVYARETTEQLQGRVLVAVDVSQSMGVTDPQREPAEKLRLARALNLGEGLCTRSQLDDWIEALQAKREIEWVGADEFPDEPARRQTEEEQRRRAFEEVCRRADELTRREAVRRLLTEDGQNLLKRVGEKHTLEQIVFSDDAEGVAAEQLAELLRRAGAEGLEGTPPSYTDLGKPLARALDLSGANRGKVLGVILLTDGQHNGGDSPIPKAIQMRDQEVPLYPVALGARKPPTDLAVIAVASPPAIFKDVDMPVKVRFKVVGFGKQKLSVKVHRPGEDKPLAERTIQHDGNDREYTESFQVRLDKVGAQPLRVTVTPLGEKKDEADEKNNVRSLVVNVADDRSKVLLIDGEARWEFHYLWNALKRDPSMNVRSVVFTQPRIGKVIEDELRATGNPWLTLPLASSPEKDPLSEYDCIILGDVLPEQLTRPDRERLEKYVADRGGTLVILAGKRAMPLGFQSGPRDEDNAPGEREQTDPLLRMLPVERPRVAAPVEGFPVTLTEEGRQTDFLRLVTRGTAEENDERWAKMPPHYWGVVGKAKPGATALAYLMTGEKGLKPEDRRQRERDNVLMARHHYGFGRVFFVGLDSTWRWRYRTGDLYHHRFWSQTIRWAASDKPLIAGNRYVRFGTPQAVYGERAPVQVVVRLSDEIAEVPAGMLARARIIRKDGDKEIAAALVPLKPKELRPRVLEGQVRDLPAGQYEIELAIPELADKLHGPPGPNGEPGKLRAEFTVSPGDNGEMVQLGTNWDLLRELAEKNGTKKVYTAEDAAELIDLLRQKEVTRGDPDETRLWQWWLTLVMVLMLLTAEWVARKWAGLP